MSYRIFVFEYKYQHIHCVEGWGGGAILCVQQEVAHHTEAIIFCTPGVVNIQPPPNICPWDQLLLRYTTLCVGGGMCVPSSHHHIQSPLCTLLLKAPPGITGCSTLIKRPLSPPPVSSRLKTQGECHQFNKIHKFVCEEILFNYRCKKKLQGPSYVQVFFWASVKVVRLNFK